MKKILAIISLCCVSVVARASVATDALTDLTKPILVTAAAPEIVLKVKSNPTTGYSWFLTDYNERLLTPVDHKYYPSLSQLVGAPGYEQWRFRVKAAAFVMPQMTTITLRYARPWDIDNSTTNIIHIVIH